MKIEYIREWCKFKNWNTQQLVDIRVINFYHLKRLLAIEAVLFKQLWLLLKWVLPCSGGLVLVFLILHSSLHRFKPKNYQSLPFFLLSLKKKKEYISSFLKKKISLQGQWLCEFSQLFISFHFFLMSFTFFFF